MFTCAHTHTHTHTHSHAFDTHTHAHTPPALTSLPPVTLGFEQSNYNVSEDDGMFSICVEVKEGQLGDEITINVSNIDIDAEGKSSIEDIEDIKKGGLDSPNGGSCLIISKPYYKGRYMYVVKL